MGLFHDHSTKEAVRLLCVDDDPATCRLYGEYGGILDWVIDQATSVDAALKHASSRAFSAIVMDQAMDRLSGIELIRTIRDTDGPNQDTPFLLCTIYPMAEMSSDLERFNVEGYLQKPVSLSRFEQAVLSLLDERSFTLPTNS